MPGEKEERSRDVWAGRGGGPVFGAAITVVRELQGLSRRQVQTASNRTYSQVRGVEVGDRWPTDGLLAAIAQPLGLSPKVVIGLRDDLVTALREFTQYPSEGDAVRLLTGWLDSMGTELSPPVQTVTQQRGVDIAWLRKDHQVAVFDVKIVQRDKAIIPVLFGAASQETPETRVEQRLDALEVNLRQQMDRWRKEWRHSQPNPAEVQNTPFLSSTSPPQVSSVLARLTRLTDDEVAQVSDYVDFLLYRRQAAPDSAAWEAATPSSDQ